MERVLISKRGSTEEICPIELDISRVKKEAVELGYYFVQTIEEFQ